MLQNTKVLFAMAHAGYFRNFENMISELLANGMDVYLHYSFDHPTIKMADYDLSKLSAKGQLFISCENAKPRPMFVAAIRLLRDIIHYAKPEFKEAHDLRARFAKLQKMPKFSAYLQKFFDHSPKLFNQLIEIVLRKLDEWYPAAKQSRELIKKIKPNYVIATPVVNFGSKEVDVIKAARAKKIITLLATASWDNLTNKGRIMIEPDHVAVWNKPMLSEAVRLHNIHPNKVWITGALPFDRWFNRSPSRNREEFCNLFNFDSNEPIIVYLCSAEGIAGTEEYKVVHEWKEQIFKNKKLSKANLLIRPHPMAITGWNKVAKPYHSQIAEFEGIKVWPLQAKHPITEVSRADFFDTLFYADALIGLNTSVMIEAAILGKPILTFLGHTLTVSQTGNLHFNHLTTSKFLSVANNLSEHILQLEEALNAKKISKLLCETFVSNFVRPLGKNINASSKLVSFIIEDMGQQHTIKLNPIEFKV